MNRSGITRPCVGWYQRSETLDAGHPPGPQVHDRLVQELELVEVDRALEVDAQLVALAHRFVHPRVEDGEPGLAVRLGHVHRHVGVADEVGGTGDGVAGAGDADRRRHDHCFSPMTYGARSS